MNVYRISFRKKLETEINDAVLELMWNYLGCLSNNGQILSNYELVHDDKELFAFVTLPDDDALNEVYNNIYVKKYRDQICETFEIAHTIVGKNMNQDISCACENPSWYILYTNYTLIESPVVCGNCGKAVPLYRLPPIKDFGYHDAVSWQRAYKQIDSLWMHCLADRFTLRQMHNPHSQLSVEGRGICKAFEEKTGKPFYYYLFQNRITGKTCPICNGDWKRDGVDVVIDYRCDACRLAADGV